MTTVHRAQSRHYGFRAAFGVALAAMLLTVPPAAANTPRAAISKGTLKSARPTARPPAPPAALSDLTRADVPVIVQGTAPNQAGYVHFFVITGPDGEAIHHVGVE